MHNIENEFFVYSLEHNYEKENGEDETKSLGIYSSEQRAQEAIERYYQLTGFNKYPIDCFHIEKYKLDLDMGWTDGFVSSFDIAQDFERMTECFNKWLGMSESAEQSCQDNNYYNTLCEISKDIYKIKDAREIAELIYKIWLKSYPQATKDFAEYIGLANNLLITMKLL